MSHTNASHVTQVYTPDDMLALLRAFAREMGSCLLFLKSVECISLSVWQPHASAPSSLYTSSLAAVPRNSFTRKRLDAAAAGGDDLFAPSEHVEVLDVATECCVTHKRIKETFVVCSQVRKQKAARRTSHVTPHTSHLTHHTSHFTSIIFFLSKTPYT